MKLVILAPVHIYDDIRVFKKEALSARKHFNTVVLYARTPEDTELVDHGVLVKPVKYKNRFQRMIKLFPLFFCALKERADIYHLHNPDTIPLVFALKFCGKKVVYDTHEDFLYHIMLRDWIPFPIRAIVSKLIGLSELLVSNVSDSFIVTQIEQAFRFKKSHLISNAPVFKDYGYPQKTHKKTLRLVYVGGICEPRGLTLMLDLLVRLNNVMETSLTLIGFLTNGQTLEGCQLHTGWKHVEYLGTLEQSEAFKHVAESDFGLILWRDVADHKHVSPNKIFEYMMMGTPFIATDFESWRNHLQGVDVGYFCDPENISDAIIEEITHLKNDEKQYLEMSQRAIDYIKYEYNWVQIEEPRLLDIYSKIVHSACNITG